jgi:hypothetical protein
MAPVSETWEQMLHRDAEWQANGGGPTQRSSGRLRVHNRPVLRRPRALAGPGAASYDLGAQGTYPAPILLAPQGIGTNFIIINLQDQIDTGVGAIPPDSMGAVGPDQFVEMINESVAIYTKTGVRMSLVSLDSFFTFTFDGTTYPRNGTTDPRILFDRRSNRWLACALELGDPAETDNQILLAVCRTSDPLTGTWDKYVIPVGVPGSGRRTFLTDFDTFGTDDNGVYFGMSIFGSDGSERAKIAATAKSTLIAASPSLGTVYQWDQITDMGSSPQPAHNQDGLGPLGLAWFVSSSATGASSVNYRTLSWSGGVPGLSATAVLPTPAYALPLDAPANGSPVNISVVDDRLAPAAIRNNHLWTCRAIGVNSSGTAFNADCTGCEWIDLDVSGAAAALVQSGRVYDPAPSGPRYYYFPSIMVNGQGNAAMSFSGSKSTEYVGAYTCGRLATDPPGTMQAVALIKNGEAPYQRLDGVGRNRWGDYSYSSLDPNDDMSIWTIQEYATSTGANIWGTWTAELLSPPPTLVNPLATTCQGGVATIPLTGTGLYGPGPGFANRRSVQVSGAGVTVTTVIYNRPTNVAIDVSVDYGVALGPRDISLTNPDRQTATALDGLVIMVGSCFDFTHDCDVDLMDFGLFQSCFNGPNRPPAAGCTVNADANGEGSVDLIDFAVFQTCFNGPNRPINAACPW